MSQSWGGAGGNGGWGGPPGGGSGTVPGAPMGAGGYPPPPGGGGYGPPPGGGGYGAPPGGFAPTPPGYPPGYTPSPTGSAVAWEDKSRPFFSRWWETVKAVNFNARAHYAGAAQNDDPWPAVTFGVVTGGFTGLVLGIFVAVMYVALGSFMAALVGGLGGGRGSAPPAAMGLIMAIAGAFAIVVYPLEFMFVAFVGPWISGGIFHGMLALMKGTTKSYTHTVRVCAYAHATQIWMGVPIIGLVLGWLVTLIFNLMALVTGLDETHKCGTGKAAAAVLLPVVLLFCCCCGFYFLIGTMGYMDAKSHR